MFSLERSTVPVEWVMILLVRLKTEIVSVIFSFGPVQDRPGTLIYAAFVRK